MPPTNPLPTLIDVHTHIYPLSYLDLLRSRQTVPYLYQDTSSPKVPPRLIILPSDDDPALPLSQRGRPVDSSYSSPAAKLAFMRTHGIRTSIISLANPWLDFLSPSEAPRWALTVNNELNSWGREGDAGEGAFYAFGTLPLSAPVEAIVVEIQRLARELTNIKGVILGTSGLAPAYEGLDDPGLDPIWSALEATQTTIFLHPHYGLPASVFGPRNGAAAYGHVLPLALGFPMETTIAFTRMYLVRVFDRFPRLKLLLAHAGGTTPFLSGRIASCVRHERHFHGGGEEGHGTAPQRALDEVLRTNVWLDAVTYGPVGVTAAVDVVGVDRVLFGTDHPFFPPLDPDEEDIPGADAGGAADGDKQWDSVTTNVNAIRDAFPGPGGGEGEDSAEARGIMSGNARALFGL